MKTNEVKLNENSKPAIFTDIDTNEKFVQCGELMINVKSETFDRLIGQWFIRTEEGQIQVIKHGDEIPDDAEISLY